MNLKFKKDVEPQGTGEFWYDCTWGGYIDPDKFLEPEDAKRIKEAINLVWQFEKEAEENETIFSL